MNTADKRISLTTIGNLAFLLCYFSTFILFFFDYLHYRSVSFHYVQIALLLILLLSRGRELNCSRNLLAIIVLLTLSLVVLIFNGSAIGNILQIVIPVLPAIAFKTSPPSKKFYKVISIFSSIMLVAYAVKASVIYEPDKIKYIPSWIAVNPNVTGLLIGYLYFFSCIDLKRTSFSCKRSICFLIALWGIIRCGSRTSLLALVLVAGFSYIHRRKIIYLGPYSYRYFYRIILFLVVAASAFPIIYVLLYRSQLFSQMVIFGKSLFTGREQIWGSAIEYIGMHPGSLFIGTGMQDFYAAAGQGQGFNLHNAYWQLFAQYGLPVTVLFISFLLFPLGGFPKYARPSLLGFNALLIVLFAVFCGIGEITFSYIPMVLLPGFAIAILYCEECSYSSRQHMRCLDR